MKIMKKIRKMNTDGKMNTNLMQLMKNESDDEKKGK